MLQVRWDAFLVLDFDFDILSGVTGPDLEGDGLPHQGLHKNLHLCVCWCEFARLPQPNTSATSLKRK